MESDGDSAIVASLYLDYNLYDELMICLETEEYGETGRSSKDKKVCAVLDKDCVVTLSTQLKIRPEDLPEHLYKEFHNGGYISRTSYVRSRFKDMLEYILDLGGKYHLVD